MSKATRSPWLKHRELLCTITAVHPTHHSYFSTNRAGTHVDHSALRWYKSRDLPSSHPTRKAMAGKKKRKQRPPQLLSPIVFSEIETLNEDLLSTPRQNSPLDETNSITREARELPYLDFLDSDPVSLQVGQTGRSFRIHRTLLHSKSSPLIAALDSNLKEGQSGVYVFEDVAEGTIARFIEWAYRGDYPATISGTNIGQTPILLEGTETDIDEKPENTTPETDLTSENHPLLVHIRLYIFSETYIVPDLQQLAYKKVTACITDLDKPNSLDTQLAVIDALQFSFLGLPPHDKLLDWLAQYAAYCLEKLRVQGPFHDLLKEFPTLSSRMILSPGPASSPPWRTTQPKYPFIQYSTKWSEDKYGH
ncbi:hypothetical protein M752DRAFT_253087 [Aspergillus phoenicis ATCC 13157]|uniref:BTB domain-containing protein n=1 Tax=Aspergillus phoenicis ATCC 13157 TaxID=1353007 RepID=A0A370PHQ3_ASPPH|nr:hypothetical protein M752DRAFT_253087 [Aspergillus phoenicis ATCC 13157]